MFKVRNQSGNPLPRVVLSSSTSSLLDETLCSTLIIKDINIINSFYSISFSIFRSTEIDCMTQKTERLRKISVRVCVLMHSTIIFNLFQFYLFMVDESLKVFRLKVARVAGVVVALVVLDPEIYILKHIPSTKKDTKK